jgi:hypothetical protein
MGLGGTAPRFFLPDLDFWVGPGLDRWSNQTTPDWTRFTVNLSVIPKAAWAEARASLPSG